jgi:hypothetical protein
MHQQRRLPIFALGGLLALSPACTAPRPVVPVGADAQITAEGLYRMKSSRLELAWVKPDVDLSRYDSFLLDPVQVSYQQRKGDYPLEPEQLEKLKEVSSTIFREAVTSAGSFTLVDISRPGALRVSAAILDLEINVPETKPGRGDTYGYEPAKMTLLVELRDATSGEILARAADRSRARSIGTKYDVVTARGDLRLALERWARIMVEALNELRMRGVETAP